MTCDELPVRVCHSVETEVKLRVVFLQGVDRHILSVTFLESLDRHTLRVQHVRVDDGEVEEVPHEVLPPLL